MDYWNQLEDDDDEEPHITKYKDNRPKIIYPPPQNEISTSTIILLFIGGIFLILAVRK